MVRIKKDIPLWELEKYGFIYLENEISKKYVHPTGLMVMIEQNKSFVFSFAMPWYEPGQIYIFYAEEDTEIVNLLFDLITDGIIEREFKLKIKEDFDLKKLERYGFRLYDDRFVTKYVHDLGVEVLVNIKDMQMYLKLGNTNRIEREVYLNMEDEQNRFVNGSERLLYDLIKLGLTERTGIRYGRKYDTLKKLNIDSFKYSNRNNEYVAILEGFYVSAKSINEKIIEYANSLIQQYETNIENIVELVMSDNTLKNKCEFDREKLMELPPPRITIKDEEHCKLEIDIYTDQYIELDCYGVYDKLAILYLEGMLKSEDFEYIDEGLYTSINDDNISVEISRNTSEIIEYVNSLLLNYKKNQVNLMQYIHEKITITEKEYNEMEKNITLRIKNKNSCTVIYDLSFSVFEKVIKVDVEGVYDKIIGLRIEKDYFDD